MDGFLGEAEKKKVVKHKGDGLIVHLVEVKMGLNLVVERMHLKEQREDVDQPVPHVKHINGEREHELANYSKERTKKRNG